MFVPLHQRVYIERYEHFQFGERCRTVVCGRACEKAILQLHFSNEHFACVLPITQTVFFTLLSQSAPILVDTFLEVRNMIYRTFYWKKFLRVVVALRSFLESAAHVVHKDILELSRLHSLLARLHIFVPLS